MRPMKKMAAVFLAAVMALALLTACGGGGGGGNAGGGTAKPTGFTYEELTQKINQNLTSTTFKYNEELQKKVAIEVTQKTGGQDVGRDVLLPIIDEVIEDQNMGYGRPVAASMGEESSKDVGRVAAALVKQMQDNYYIDSDSSHIWKDAPILYFVQKEAVGYTYYAVFIDNQ